VFVLGWFQDLNITNSNFVDNLNSPRNFQLQQNEKFELQSWSQVQKAGSKQRVRNIKLCAVRSGNQNAPMQTESLSASRKPFLSDTQISNFESMPKQPLNHCTPLKSTKDAKNHISPTNLPQTPDISAPKTCKNPKIPAITTYPQNQFQKPHKAQIQAPKQCPPKGLKF